MAVRQQIAKRLENLMLERGFLVMFVAMDERDYAEIMQNVQNIIKEGMKTLSAKNIKNYGVEYLEQEIVDKIMNETTFV